MAKKESPTKQPKGNPQPEKVRVQLPDEDRRRMVAEAAYYIAKRRGFAAGDPAADWAAAEKEIDELLMDTKAPN